MDIMAQNRRGADSGGGNSVKLVDLRVPRGGMMAYHPPYRIFGYELAACHGVPAMVTLLGSLIVCFMIVEAASQSVKPVTLDSIWVEPRIVTAAQIMGQNDEITAVELHKTGSWSRLCSVSAKQTFVDERGGSMIQGEYHTVDTPKGTGRFFNKSRGLQIPKLLANQQGLWRVKIENSGVCNWFEKFMPITGMAAEATFEIVP